MVTETEMYRVDLGYLQKIRWQDGTRGYCRRCDDAVPFTANARKMLECEQGHEVHPANLIVSGELNT